MQILVIWSISSCVVLRCGLEFLEDGIGVVDAAAPDASAGLDECGPEAGVVGERGVRREVGTWGAGGEKSGAFGWG